MSNEEKEKLFKVALQLSEKGDYERHAGILQDLSLSGYSPAMYYLAKCYHEGYGVPQSTKHAEYWIRVSLLHGEPNSVPALAGLMYNPEKYPNSLEKTRKIIDWGVEKKIITDRDRKASMSIFEEAQGKYEQTQAKYEQKFRKTFRTGKVIFDFPASACV